MAPHRNHATVLLAGGDAGFLAQYGAALEAQGFRWEPVSSPTSLQEKLRAREVRPVLLLPGTHEWLPSQEWPRGWPVCLLTPRDPNDGLTAALADGVAWLRDALQPAPPAPGEHNLPDVLGRLALTFSIARDLGLTRSPLPAETPSERIYQTIFDTMTEGVAVFDSQGIVRAFNAAAVRISGWSAEQMLGLPLNAPKYRCYDASGRLLDHTEYPAMVCLRTRQPTIDEVVGIVRPDGKTAWVSCCCQPILIDGGDGSVGVLSTIRDITERRQAEQARQASEAALRSFFDSAPLFMGVIEDLGEDLLIVRINSYGAQAFALEPQAMQGRTSRSLGISDEHLQLWRQKLVASRQLGQPVSFQYSYDVNGQANWLSATVCPLTDAPADQYCFVVDIITARVRAEETVRLQQAQIAHVQRVSSLGQMASELAHELNQPLFAIGNFAAASLQALDELSEAPPTNLRHWLTQIAAQADRAGQIVHRLHRFVRKSPTTHQRLELAELIREGLELVAVDARLHGVELECIETRQPIHVFADRIQVQQVLVNLVLNGIEAMSASEANHRKLTVRVQLADAAGHAALIVRDRGRGLDAVPIERLFEPYFSTKPNGSGMGLTISREIARSLGGDLAAAPASGPGAQFTLTLPLHEGADD